MTKKMHNIDNSQDSIMSVMAAMLVLFTTMLDPRISAGLAVVMMFSFAAVKYNQSRKGK